MKDIKKIRKMLKKMKKQTIVFDEDTSIIIAWVFNKKLYSKFKEKNQYYLVHIYYQSAKWNMVLLGQAKEELTKLYRQWDAEDKDLWMQNAQKYLNSMVKSELEDIKKPINRKIIEIVIIDQMNTMASMFFRLNNKRN